LVPIQYNSCQYELMPRCSRPGRLEASGSRSRQRRLYIASTTHGLIAFSLAHWWVTSCPSPFIGIKSIEFGFAHARHGLSFYWCWRHAADTAFLLEPSLYRYNEQWQHGRPWLRRSELVLGRHVQFRRFHRRLQCSRRRPLGNASVRSSVR